MAKVVVFTAEEFQTAVNKDVASVLTIEKKKNSKEFNGTEFLDAKWNIGAHKGLPGYFSATNIELTDGIADPADTNDKRTKFESNRLQLSTNLSKSGAFGDAINKLNAQFKKTVDDLAKKNIIDMDRKGCHDLMQYTLSKKNEKNPGGKIEDPILRLSVDFDLFAAKHPVAFLRGKPKTEFYDARTEYKDENGRTQYKLATVEVDGKEVPLDAKNVHLFVTPGSKIVYVRIMIPSVPVSQSWVSMPMIANKVVLLPGTGGGFTDDDFVPANNNVAAALKPNQEAADSIESVKPAETPAVVAPAATTPVKKTADEKEIDDALSFL